MVILVEVAPPRYNQYGLGYQLSSLQFNYHAKHIFESVV